MTGDTDWCSVPDDDVRDESMVFQHALGKHVLRLRLDRDMTQEVLAVRGGISVDTIRRLENGVLAPSIITLKKVAHGLDLRVSTLLAAIENDEANENLEFHDFLTRQRPEHRKVAISVVHNLMAKLDDISSPQRDKKS